MNPYYSHAGITILHGDCRVLLSEIGDKTIHLACTDPPYGISFYNGDLLHAFALRGERAPREEAARAVSRRIEGDATQEDGEELLGDALKHVKRVLVNGGCCCCCCGGGGGPRPLFARWSLLLDEIIGFKQAVVWDKGGIGIGVQLRRSYEFVLIAQKGGPTHAWNGGRNTSNVWRIPKIIPRWNQHPTEKPVALMQKCISLFTNEGDLVLDPFCGTGATLVAAKKLHRRAIGIELEERYAEIAARKLEQEVLPYKEKDDNEGSRH